MGLTLAVSNLHGGTGKTMTCVMLAFGMSSGLSGAFVQEKKSHRKSKNPSLILLDCDPNRDGYSWLYQAGDPGFAYRHVAPTAPLGQVIAKAREEYQTVLVDCPASNHRITLAAAEQADLVIVPSTATRSRITEMSLTIDLLMQAAQVNSSLLYWVLLTMVDTRSVAAQGAREYLEQQGIPVMQSQVRRLERQHEQYGFVPKFYGDYENVLKEVQKWQKAQAAK
jgi:cellulose biosynthesis protein BcsQ